MPPRASDGPRRPGAVTHRPGASTQGRAPGGLGGPSMDAGTRAASIPRTMTGQPGRSPATRALLHDLGRGDPAGLQSERAPGATDPPTAPAHHRRPALIGEPGAPPFTRGIHPTGYRGRLWTMRMFAGFGSAEDTNARFRAAPRRRPDRPLDRLRHAHPVRLRHRRRRRPRASSAPAASRSARWPTWRSCSPGSRSTGSAPR